MNCKEAEPLIALYVEGDAPPPKHLAGCAACRRLEQELRESQAALKEWNREEIDPVLLDAVRERVLARLAAPRRTPWFRWWWLAVPVAACMLAAVILRPAPPDLPPLPRAALRIPPAPAAPRIVWPKPVPEPQYASVPKHPLLMKILTDDPNIVIYWIVDSPKEGE